MCELSHCLSDKLCLVFNTLYPIFSNIVVLFSPIKFRIKNISTFFLNSSNFLLDLFQYFPQYGQFGFMHAASYVIPRH